MRARVGLIMVAMVVAVLIGGCSLLESVPTPGRADTSTARMERATPVVRQEDSTSTVPTSAPSAAVARGLLATLAVKGRAPKTGYGRSKFGRAWTDHVAVAGGRNGCNTRDDILQRDLRDVTLRAGGCKVASGTLDDPYTGRTIAFVRGRRTSTLVQIDHVVALADAWQKGAQRWPTAKRLDFANDPRNLQAVDGATNRRKSAGDAATWLPPNKAYRCTYVARQIEVKAAYGLWVTAAERDAMVRVLRRC